MDWIVPILALIVAACGALLAYVVSRRNNPGLKITVGKEDPWMISGPGTSVRLYIGFVNSGDMPISLAKVGLVFGTRLKHHSVDVDNPFPHKDVTRGQLYKVPVNVALDVQQLLWAWAIDTTGKRYRSKVHPIIKAD